MTLRLGSLLDASPVLRAVRGALGDEQPWLVGGTVRDLILGRLLDDVDVVVAGDAKALARRLATAVDGHVFALSERFGGWRVISPDRSWQADVTPVRGGSIEADLAMRDFTINAMAVPLVQGEPLIDPHGGLADLEARALRVVSERVYGDDPLRTLRLARFACELHLDVEPATAELARANAGAITQTAPERIFGELRRLLAAEAVLRGLELMDETGLVAILFPELDEQKDVEQNPYHHRDVWGHTLEVVQSLVGLQRDLQTPFGALAEPLQAELGRPLADGLTRGEALRFGALVHDIGKPRTRRVTDDGRVLFLGHDQLGAEMVADLCRRLRTSTELSEYLAGITRHHLVLGFLVHEQPLSRRHVYRYMRTCEPVELEVTLLSVADRLATRGERTRQEAVDAHLALAREIAAEALEWRRRGAGDPPVRGDELMRELGLDAGPRVGELLELLREAAWAGEVSSRSEALALARRAQER